MRWSQLKQRVEANFAPRVRGRIELFQTRYRHAADSFGEAWVVVDGKRRYSWADIHFIKVEAAGYRADRAMRGANRSREECCEASRRVKPDRAWNRRAGPALRQAPARGDRRGCRASLRPGHA